MKIDDNTQLGMFKVKVDPADFHGAHCDNQDKNIYLFLLNRKQVEVVTTGR